jgi:hypothetical protein
MIVNAYYMLSNIEKEKLVIDLYYNQQKNVLQTAQEARMSFRDIAAILKKKEAAEVNDGSSSSSDGRNGIVKSNQKKIDMPLFTIANMTTTMAIFLRVVRLQLYHLLLMLLLILLLLPKYIKTTITMNTTKVFWR